MHTCGVYARGWNAVLRYCRFLTAQLYQVCTIYILTHSVSQQEQLDYLQYCGDVPVHFPDQEIVCLVLVTRHSVPCEATSKQCCLRHALGTSHVMQYMVLRENAQMEGLWLFRCHCKSLEITLCNIRSWKQSIACSSRPIAQQRTNNNP